MSADLLIAWYCYCYCIGRLSGTVELYVCLCRRGPARTEIEVSGIGMCNLFVQLLQRFFHSVAEQGRLQELSSTTKSLVVKVQRMFDRMQQAPTEDVRAVESRAERRESI
jgi:hypothetical protein